MRRFSLGLAAGLMMIPAAASAADVPAIKTSDSNKVPECVTPGRLTAYLKSRNEALDPRFEKIAVEYMRRGEELGLRWDYTFYQMLLETGNLSYRGDKGRRGDVSAKQNNFAGLGATGNGNPGESFPDMQTGVLAHLQHVLLYAGETVENPVAERTRKVQEWGILKGMKQKARGPITFRHLATKWAPGADYVAGLTAIAEKFESSSCNAADPHPEWVAEARGIAATKTAAAEPAAAPESKGAALARRAIEDGKADDDNRLTGLGAAGVAKAAAIPSFSLLNPPRSEEPAKAGTAPPKTEGKTRVTRTAAAAAAGAGAAGAAGKAAGIGAADAEAAGKGKCRVWTASYGGLKALIIRVRSDKGTDYTVLDVNEGQEKREADAYIAAYAKGGEVAGEYQSQNQALDKAFELCPEN
jgi:hypothetical protein